MSVKIFDCFMFFNELDILELRLQELSDVVDRFVIVESNKTHVGALKPLYFAENAQRFAPYMDKIVYVPVTDMPDNPDPWVLENHQRNSIVRGLYGLGDNDIVMISDVDEIPRSTIVEEMKNSPQEVFGLRMTMSYFYFNYICVHGEAMTVWTTATRGRHIHRITPQGMRNMRFSLHKAKGASLLQEQFASVQDHAGWHFSYIGDENHIKNKIKNFTHQEFNSEAFLNGINIDSIVQAGADVYGRDGYQWAVFPFNDYFPKTIQNNRNRYKDYIREPL